MIIFQDKIYRIEQLSFFISPLFFIIILAIIKLIVNHEILLISKDATPHFMMLCILTLASMILVAGLFSFIQISFFIIKKKFSFLIFRIFFLLLIPIEYGFLQEYRDSIRGAFRTGRQELIPIIISLIFVLLVYKIIFNLEKKKLSNLNTNDIVNELYKN